MEPGTAPIFSRKREQRVPASITAIAVETTVRSGAYWIAQQPLGYTAGQGASFGFLSRNSRFELGNRSAFVEKGPPILSGPTAVTSTEEGDDGRFVLGQFGD
jgi:hypothetical protein